MRRTSSRRVAPSSSWNEKLIEAEREADDHLAEDIGIPLLGAKVSHRAEFCGRLAEYRRETISNR